MNGSSQPKSSIKNKIVMAFILVIVCWGIVISRFLEHELRTILVQARLPSEKIWKIIDEFTLLSTGFTMVGILLFIGIAIYFAKAVTLPVKQLMQGVERIARGDLEVEVNIDSRDEFGQLAESFNQMVKDLGQVDKLKSEFISTVSHELRTPLAAILGFSELLLVDDFPPEEKRKFLTYIHEKADYLAQQVEELLDISRIEKGKGLELKKALVPVGDILWKVVSGFQESSPGHRIELALPDGPMERFVDRLKLERVMENLLSNAIKYSPRGGVVRIAVGRAGNDLLQVSVEDQGTGMTLEQVEKIFDKFYRADTSNTTVGGVGLGMSIVKNIVEAHGGEIWVKSEPGKGTIVTFTLSVTEGREEPSTESGTILLNGEMAVDR